MDEKKIKAIYLELKLQKNLIHTKATNSGKSDDPLWEELGRLNIILADLEENAANAGIYLAQEMTAVVDFEVNENDDWLQLLESSMIGTQAKDLLRTQLEGLDTELSATAVWPVINAISKYYDANVRNASNMKIIEYQTNVLKGRKLQPNADGILIHQEVALDVLFEKIKALTADLKLDAEKDLHPRFEELYKQRIRAHCQVDVKVATLADDMMDSDKSTFEKVDDALEGTAQFRKKLIDDAGILKKVNGLTTGPLVFRDWSFNGSIKVDYTTQAHLASLVVRDACDTWANFHIQAFRQTIDLGSIKEAFKPSSFALTPLSIQFHVMEWPYGKVVLKTEVHAIKLEKLLEDAMKMGDPGEMTITDLRFSITLDLLKTPAISGAAAVISDKMNLKRAEFTASLGATLKVDIPKLRAMVALLKKGATKAVDTVDDIADAVKEFRDKTSKVRQHIMDDADELKKLAEGAMDAKKKPNEKALKAVTEQFKKHTDELKNIAEKFADKSQVAKKAADKVVKEIGEAVAEKLGKKVIAFMAKVGAKAIPGIGQAMLIYDLATLGWWFGKGIWALHQDISNGSLRWEDRVAEWLGKLGS